VALALYRKYRPRTFAEVIGQEHVTEPLSQALRSGRLHHAYLFSGPRGCGKTSSARILARSLNCEQGPTPEPCGVCGSCRSLTNDGTGSIDVIEIDAASHGGVDDARDLREKAFFAPASSRYKIYVIDEAHMVSPAGFNALLKLVEEPPEYVKFIFATTEPEKVLGTIRSRTHHYPFRLIPPAVLRPYLQQLTEAEGVQVEPSVFPLVVRAGGGSARDSLSVLDQLIAGAGPEGVSYHRAVALLGVTDVTLLDEMCDALAAGDGAAAYSTIDQVAEAGHDPRRFASDLLERFRDLIVLQQVPDAVTKGLIDGPADQLETMGAQAARLGPATLSRCADIVHNGLVEMRGTTAPRLLLELVTARMLLPGAEDSTGALLQRLERMERRLALGGEPSARPEAAASAAATSPTSVPSVPSAPAGGLDGSGKSAARAAALAAARRASNGGGSGRPAAAQAQASAPAAVPVSAVPVSAVPVSASPAAVPVSSAPVSAVPVSAVPVSAASVGAAPVVAVSAGAAQDGNEVADGSGAPSGGVTSGAGVDRGGAGEADDEPPWDDEPEFDLPDEAVPARSVESVAETALVLSNEAATEAVLTREAEAVPAQAEPTAVAAGRQGEPAGVLPDAPEEPGAAAVEAAAAGPGQLTAQAVRQVWPEVLAEVRKQPRGVVLRAMAADATVRELAGETVVLTVPSPRHAQGITQGAAIIVKALYEVLGGQWAIRCEIAGAAGATSYGSAPTPAPQRDSAVQQASVRAGAAPSSSAQTGRPAVTGRAPHTQRRPAAAPASGDDDWPEPARPGGLSASAVAPAAVADDDEDWPEVRAIPAGASDRSEENGSEQETSGSVAGGAIAEDSAPGDPVSRNAAGSGSAMPDAASGDAAAEGAALAGSANGAVGSDGVVGDGPSADGGGSGANSPGRGAVADRGGAAGGGAAGGGAAGGGAAGGGAASSGDRVAGAGLQPGGDTTVAGRSASGVNAAREATPVGGAGGPAGRSSGPGSGLAAARAAAAGARAAVGTRQAAKSANDAWTDGSPAEEAPYDPEFDGPPSSGKRFDGFDPGDEPLDDVIDEKTARESSEQQAMRLLQEAFGAEKIGES